MEVVSKIIGIALLIGVVVVIATFALQYFWAWLMPEILPRFVEEGYITSELKFWEAFWLSTMMSLIGFKSSSSSSK